MSDRRDKRINIRLTQDEYDIISKRAKDADLNITSYIIKSCLGKQILGNNINQIARLANSGQIQAVNMGEFLTEYNAIGKSIIDLLERRRWR